MFAVARTPLALSIVASLALAGCSGTAGTGGPGPLPAHGAASALAAGHRHRTTARLTIRIPRKVRTPGRHPRFVSPSTQSATIALAPALGCAACSSGFSEDLGLTPGSPNCTAGASGTSCTFTFVLEPGTYAGSMTTYDGPLSAGHPTGSVLSLAQSFPLSVVAGAANVPVIDLYGVPANIECVPVSATITITEISGCNPALFVVAPGATSSFSVYALDVDGNLMLGPGAPAFSASGATGFTFTTKGSTMYVTTPTIATTEFPLTITATSPACSQTGAVCSYGEDIAFDSVVAIADSGGNDVQVYSRLAVTSGSGAPYATITNGISTPDALAFDKNGNLFVVNTGNNTVTEYAPPYAGAPSAVMSADLNLPFAIALAGNGAVGVLNGGTATAEVYEMPYNAAPYQISLGSSSSTSLAFDGNENLWISFYSNTVERYSAASSYAALDYLLDNGSNGITHPTSVLLDSSNNLYVGEGKVVQFPGPNYTGAPALTSNAFPSIGAIVMDGAHGTLGVCFNGGVAFLRTSDLSEFYSQDYTNQTCMPAFDRFQNLELAFSGPAGALTLTYYSQFLAWNPGRSFTSPLLNSPAAIASWP